MVKKKPAKDEEEDLEEDIGDFEDDEIEALYPKVEKDSASKKVEEKVPPHRAIKEEEQEEEDLEEYLEEQIEIPEYKYLDLQIVKEPLKNDYIVKIIGQSHGFCNMLVKHLLKIKGVNIAAYKATGLEPPNIFIRLENGAKIKEILHEGIELVRKEVDEVKKLFLKVL